MQVAQDETVHEALLAAQIEGRGNIFVTLRPFMQQMGTSQHVPKRDMIKTLLSPFPQLSEDADSCFEGLVQSCTLHVPTFGARIQYSIVSKDCRLDSHVVSLVI